MSRQIQLFGTPQSGAEFSECGKYRYALWRIWDESRPMVTFIGLNPSTANESTNDPTIRRVIGFAKKWGFGGVYMLNLFAIVSSDPKILTTTEDPIGPHADKWMDEITQKAHTVVFAWGAFSEVHTKDRAREIIGRYPKAICLNKTRSGAPRHPLYSPSLTQPYYFNHWRPWTSPKEEDEQ